MKKFFLAILGSLLLMVIVTLAEVASTPHEREYPFPESSVRAALQNLGAYSGSRLPSLEGFISGDDARPEAYQRPYYEFKIELLPAAAGHTVVRVFAKVSAWHAENNSNGVYRTLTSNGRLEDDLLDRLSEYLGNKSADPAALQVRIQQTQNEIAESKRQLAELEMQLEHLKNAPPDDSKREFAAVTKSQTTVWSAPSQQSKAVLKAQVEDQFEVLEQRGVWLRVALDDSRDGWIPRSQVKLDSANVAGPDIAATKTEFAIIREMASDFSGDLVQLKGKKALYIWARPEGSGLNLSGNKLQFATNLFLQRYREISHASQNPVAGVVVIFLDQKGGVAAASLDDIRLFADGSLSQERFLKKCSFDPPSAFPASPKLN